MSWAATIGAVGAIGGGLLSAKGAKDANAAAAAGTQQKIDPRQEQLLYGGNIEGVYHPGAYDYLRNELQKGRPQYYPGETVAGMNPFHQSAFQGAGEFNNSGQALGGYNAVNQFSQGLLSKGNPNAPAYQAYQPPKIDMEALMKMYNAPPPSYGRQPIVRIANDLQPGMRAPLGDGSNGQGGVDKTPSGGEDDGKGGLSGRVKSKLPGSKPSLGKMFGF